MSSQVPIPFASDRTAAISGPGTREPTSRQPGTSGTRSQAHSGLSRRSQKGDAFVFLDLPPGAHVGCDTLVGTTNQRSTEPADATERRNSSDAQEPTGVCGFRDIPPGTHFAWISAPGAMSRQGWWFIAKQQSTGTGTGTGTDTGAGDDTGLPQGITRLKKWDPFHEALADFEYPEQGTSACDDIAKVYSQLIPYSTGSDKRAASGSIPDHESHGGANNDVKLWRQLTSFVTVSVLRRIAGSPALATTVSNEWEFATTDTSKNEVAMPGGSRNDTGTGASRSTGYSEFSFLFAKDDLDAYRLIATQEKNKDGADKDCQPDSYSNDTTERILALLEHPESQLTEADIIGELQFAFLTGIVLSNLSCLEQWWHFLLRVLLRACHLVDRRPSLCRAFLETLHAQLTYLERFTTGKITRLSARNGLIGEVNDGENSDSGTSIFDAKPQGAARLRASLAVFRRQFKFSNNDGKADSQNAQVDEKSILTTSLAEASAAEAFMDLEALLWKYGWDLSGSGDRDEGDQAAGNRNDYHEDNDDDELELYDTPLQEGAQVGTRHSKIHTALSDSDDDDDDYQPVIVEMDEDGKEVGLVSWD
ncbi:aar2 domain containing protein [Ophiostoma piceae UAMH 11346]|uniref:Aar2 domain containing protein n=1 Tax=Ophiostoma piceae (strain UAMH 11346) TaxID=1262450 RepID=S3DBP2_OPHP1|nr:aar2 domain containing protein [Ophiostoma piceae UAMH 11346]